MNLSLPNDAKATVPVTFTDEFGGAVSVPASGVNFVSSNPAAATVTFDTDHLVVTPVANGATSITADGLSGSLDVSVIDPVATSVGFGAATLSPVTLS